MALDDIVQIIITTQATPISRVGHGTPLIMSYHTNWVTRAKEYAANTALADMVTDGFATTDPAYLCAQSILSQNPRPTKIILGREENTQKKKVKITPTATLEASTDYIVYVNGLEAKFTSDATPTVAEITAGLKTAIDALSQNVTVTDNTTDLDIEANTVADWFRLKINLRRQLIRLDNTPDGTGGDTFADDLTAVINENNNWYSLHLTNHSKAIITAAAASIEALKKIMVTCSGDDAITTTASDDVASTLKTSAYARTVLMFHPEPYEFGGAAWAGLMLPKDPGSATWKFKTIAGVPVYVLTADERSKTVGKYCNVYETVAGINVTAEGITPANEFIDITRGVDWLRQRMQERIFASLANQDKVPYTDIGVGLVENDIWAQIREGIGNDFLAESPEPTVTVPAVADVSTADRAARLLPDVEFTATLAGAIHSLQISGIVSV